MAVTVTGVTRKDPTTVESAPTFVLRTTKPNAATFVDIYGQQNMKVGAGGDALGRAAPTAVLNYGDSVPNGSWSAPDLLTISTGDIKDYVVNGRVKLTGTGQKAENLIVKGDPARPVVTGTPMMVDTTGAINALVRYCTVRPTYVVTNGLLSGIGRRNVTIEYCDVSGVCDGFDPTPPDPTHGLNDCAMVIRGCYVHDMMFTVDNSGAHGNTPTTRADGTSLSTSSPYWNGGAGVPWDHSDICQIENDTATGISIYGNNFIALWDSSPVVSQTPLPLNTTGGVFYKELSCLMLNGGRDLVIEDNWFDGGEQCINNNDSAVTGVFHRNRFGRQMLHTGTGDTTYDALVSVAAGVGLDTGDGTADQNVWEDTGAVVLPK